MIFLEGGHLMYPYGLHLGIGLIIFAIHYMTMTKLTPLNYRPVFKYYSIGSHVLFFLVKLYGWFFSYPLDLARLIPVGLYSLIFGPLAGVILYSIFRHFNSPEIDLINKWKYLMLACYSGVIITTLYYGYYIFKWIFF